MREAVPVEPDWGAPVRTLASLRASMDQLGQAASIGDTVLVGGRVVAGTGLLRADINEVYVQDGTGGLRLVLGPEAEPVLVGDSVIAYGVVSQYLGTLELAAPTVRKVNAPPRPIEPVRLPDQNPDLEAVEGQLVEVRGHVTQSDSTDGGRLLVLFSGTTATQVYAYRFRAAPVDFNGIQVGDYVRVRGIAAQHDLAPPFNNSYIVFPRSSADVRRIGVSPSTYRTGALVVGALLLGALLWATLLRRMVQARTEALTDSEARYTHLFDATADPVLVLDDEGRITDANETGRRVFGVNPTQKSRAKRKASRVLLRALAAIPDDADAHLEAARSDECDTAVLELKQADGRMVPFEMATRMLDTRHGTAFVAIARDVEERRAYEQGLLMATEVAEEARTAADAAREESERARQESEAAHQASEAAREESEAAREESERARRVSEAARQASEAARQESEAARREAEAAAQLKSSILANMSHEVRTPLTAILGFSDVLAEEVPEDLFEFADAIRTGGNRLLVTLNDILDLSRLDAGRMELVPEPFDAVESMRTSVRLLAPLAQKAGIGLSVGTGADEIPVILSQSAFDRIVTNLVGNAIKFTPSGEVRVTLRTRDGRVVLQVRDTGVGIGDAFLPDLFEPFKQESNHEHGRAFEGTGLGLAITHRLVERVGGSIEVESTLGEGTVFTVSFPAPHASDGAAGAEPDLAPAASL